MKSDEAARTTIDAYIADFPPDVQRVMQEIRATIREAAPGAEECISYRIPTFKVDGHPVVYFAGFKKHIGLYPVPVGNAELGEALSPYASGRGTAQFPLGRPVPFDLVRRIVEFRVHENAARAAAKRKKKT
jgi:uncharacterized protein YdhG (YjbR/CyaY superfamily)